MPTTASRVVEPATSTESGDESVIDATRRRTVIVIASSSPPLRAEMTAAPSSTAVTTADAPDPSTVAMLALLECHDTTGAPSTYPSPSRTTAVTARVSPADVIVSVDATVTTTLPTDPTGAVVLP